MILLLDVGNNRIKWGVLQDGKLAQTGARTHNPGDLQTLVSKEWGEIPRPSRVMVSNVMGEEFAKEFDKLLKTTWGINAEYVVSARSVFGVTNAYHEPAQLGVDRWAALIAARHDYTGSLCIIDCGTALTLDLLAADGQHLGGLIIPGFSMMQSALQERTAGIKISSEPDSTPDDTKTVLPVNTRDAVYAGVLYASIAVIDRVIDDLSQSLGIEITGIITGGDAPLISPLLKKKYVHEPNLVLKGLAIIAGQGS